jgi:hypothetical protein
MRYVAARTNVRVRTLYFWHEKLRTEPLWRPSRDHFSNNHHTFPDDVEAIFADLIQIKFLEKGRSLTRTTLQPLILMLVHDLVAERVLDDSFLNFKCSRHCLSRFRSMIELDFKRARPARRTAIDGEECLHFLSELTGAYHRYPLHVVFNFDEPNWHLVMAGDEVVAARGDKTVRQYVEGDAKVNFLFFATITAEGGKLLLILVVKRKADLCHKQFEMQTVHNFTIWYSSSAWSTETLMLQYVDWLRAQMAREPLCLVVDQYGTHITQRGHEGGGIGD